MAMPSFVGSTVTENGPTTTTTYSIDFGVAGLSDGDEVFIILVCDATAVSYDATTYNTETWTLISTAAALGSRSGQIFARTWKTGNSHVFNYRRNRANSDGVLAVVFRGGVLANLITGTGKARSAAPVDTSLQSTALSVTTTTPDTLAIAIGMEATSAAETGTFLTGPTIPAGWTQVAYRAQTGTINTIVVATKPMASAGASGDMAFTYQNTQGSNGWAIQLALPAPAVVTPPTNNGLAGVYVDASGVAHNGYLFYNDAANVQHPVSLPTMIYKPYTVSQVMQSTSKSPWLSIHRGGSSNYPEEVMDGYRACAQRGARMLEISVQYSQNGTPWCFHDGTTDRTTGVSGTIPNMTDVQLAALSNLGSTANLNPTQRSRPVAKFVDVVAAFKDTHVLVVEDKTYSHLTSFLALLNSYGTAGRPASEIFVVKMDATADSSYYSAARAAGFKTWGYIFDGDMAAKYATALTHGMDMIGMDYHSTDATLIPAIAQAKALNIMPTGHIVGTRAIRDRLLGLGMQGIMMGNVDAIF